MDYLKEYYKEKQLIAQIKNASVLPQPIKTTLINAAKRRKSNYLALAELQRRTLFDKED